MSRDGSVGSFEDLHGDGYILRALTLDDASDLAARRSDPETARFQSWTVPYPVERATALIEGQLALGDLIPGEWFQLAIVATAGEFAGRIVGDIALHLDQSGRFAQLGYTLHPWARGRGYATKASATALDYLVTVRGVHRIEASADPRNTASTAVLERLGFTLEGIKRESYLVGDEITDDAIYGLLAREWRARG